VRAKRASPVGPVQGEEEVQAAAPVRGPVRGPVQVLVLVRVLVLAPEWIRVSHRASQE
jgi:hypothetical protein